jgi:prepilin-type N-terminal cleavage/methylation domain-containing protein
MLWSTKFKNKGYSLIEVIVALGIFLIISGALLTLLNMGLKITRNDKAKDGALAIATEKMEVIKNLPYDNIGLVGGIPSGDIEPTVSQTLNNITYTVETDINFIDDAFDGLITTGDTLSTDYKQARVEVSWEIDGDAQPVVFVTNIAPKGMEQASGMDTGALQIEVYNNVPSPIEGATVTVVNNAVTPAISRSAETNENGIFLLNGAPISTQGYEITVTKEGYSTSQTYSVDLINNPNPNPGHLSVGLGDVTTKAFFIDELSTLNITAKTSERDLLVPGFIFTLAGNKYIGTDGAGTNIPKYSEELTTDATGLVALSEFEPDTYNISFDNIATGYDLAGYTPLLPIIIPPSSTTNLTIYLAPHSTDNLLLTVLNPSGNVLTAASVRLYNASLSYDETLITNINGQVFFSPLTATDYSLEITLSGYQTYTDTINISTQTQQNVSLALSV